MPLRPTCSFADLALGKGHELDICEGELLVEAGNVLLIAAETIKTFCKDDIERSRASVF